MSFDDAPKFDVRLWCLDCRKAIGEVNNVPTNDPRDLVSQAMTAHALQEHHPKRITTDCVLDSRGTCIYHHVDHTEKGR